MTPEVTVVVVTWQGRHLLGSCLAALAGQTVGPGRFEVVVVDNASTDGTAELLSRSPVRVITSMTNLGFAGGATLGLRAVTTPFAVVLNDDAVPEPDWLEQLLAGFDTGVAAVTSKVLLAPRYALVDLPAAVTDVSTVTVDGTDVTTSVVARGTPTGTELAVPVAEGLACVVVVGGPGRQLLVTEVAAGAKRVDILNSTGGVLLPTGHGADRGYLEVDRGQYDDRLDVFAVCGAAAAFRTDVGAAAGWFDPWLFAYYEDLDLSWRLRRSGWEIRYVPAARVRHRHAATSTVGSDVFLFHNRRNRLAVLARNASARELLQVATAGRRARPERPASLLAAPGPQPTEARPRGKGAALRSFLARLPWLLIDRLRHPVPAPSLLADAGS